MKGRPTLYKGIQMRSRLEADYAGALDRDSASWEYEPTCFAADGVQWLPDFRITYASAPGLARYVEVKPATLLTAAQGMAAVVEQVDAILRRMSVAWDSEPNAILTLVLHTYGRHWPDFEVSGIPGRPWMCVDNLTPNAMELVWPGMGQRDALPTANAHAAEVAASAR
jgi:hypothetical protein